MLRWLSPWYATTTRPRTKDGLLVGEGPKWWEVDYSEWARAGAGHETTPPFKQYPSALTHQQVRDHPELRSQGIDRLRAVLSKSGTTVIPLLVLQVANAETEECVTVVLDGNHRLAAALRGDQGGAFAPTVHTVIVFQLEKVGLVAGEDHEPEAGHDDRWHGFNPDVGLAKLPPGQAIQHRVKR